MTLGGRCADRAAAVQITPHQGQGGSAGLAGGQTQLLLGRSVLTMDMGGPET